ncbi:MAG TPA: protein kinase [Terriglobia bacterium]|nr:protein kinase [Terriglobia bacterium]
MAIGIGSSVGSYQITARIGVGGMGEVYRALDGKLKRDVAIKCLPDSFAKDPERIARMQREAEVLASLNHAHIAAIYDLQQIEGARFLVLELVEGETIADRLQRGPIPLREAVEIAKQIAEALEAAHEKGVMHRDLKPANIKINPDGQVKVLDFGLAKILDQPLSQAHISDSPTKTAGTLGGVILGTAAYMSPEQARGQEAGRISDIWAFGCVLFEMLTGRRAFQGETVTDLLGAVLKDEPDLALLPKETPPSVRKLLGRCLQKDRKRRLHDMADARIELEDVLGEKGPDAEIPTRNNASRLAWAIAVLAIAVAAGLAFYSKATPDQAETRVEINTPQIDRSNLADFAISPDGRKLVFVVSDGNKRQLWLRSLDSTDAQLMAGTDGAILPFWSPRSDSIGFFADGKLKRIDINGAVQTLADAIVGGRLGGSWSPTGDIIFNGAPGYPLYRVSEKGGERTPVTRVAAPRQGNHSRPQFLPDGRRFLLFVDAGNPEDRGVYIGSLDSPEVRLLFAANSPAVFTPPDRLMFLQQGTLFVRRFDPENGELDAEPLVVAQRVAAVSASWTDVVAYRTLPEGSAKPVQIAWYDRSGKPLGLVTESVLSPELSPDGAHLAFYRGGTGINFDVWTLDLVSRRESRITTDPTSDGFPTWSPDSRQILFSSKQGRELHVRLASGGGAERTLFESPEVLHPSDWSPDGRFILIQRGRVSRRDLYALSLSNDGTVQGEPIPVMSNAAFEERDAKFSPDGRWIAYQSNDTGRFEIYIVPFPSLDSKVPISSGGGVMARWRQDGRELFYLSPDGKLMSVAITLSADGKTLKAGAAAALFQTEALTLEPSPDINGHNYEVSRDGKRFLLYTRGEDSITSPITLIQNWTPFAK